MIDNLSIALKAFPILMLTSFSVDEILQPRNVNWFTNLGGLLLNFGDGFMLFETQELSFICIHIEANASRCLFQTIPSLDINNFSVGLSVIEGEFQAAGSF